jgi:WD40 repeat protein
VTLWNIAEHRRLGEPFGGPNVTSINVSPTGKTIAITHEHGGGALWDLATRHQTGEQFTVPHDAGSQQIPFPADDLAFSPDGKTLAAYWPGTVQLWNIDSHQPIGGPFTTSTIAGTRPIAISPDGNTLLSDRTLWNIATRSSRCTNGPLGEPEGLYLQVDDVAFSPDSRTLATVGPQSHGSAVRLWDVATCRQVGQPLTGHTDEVYAVAFSPDGKTLATAGKDNTVRLWNPTQTTP